MARYSLNGDRKRSRFGILRIFLEIPVIVLSIYIAFVVDEWGKEKTEIQLEKKYLQELYEEIKINREELRIDQDERRLQVVLLEKLLETPVRQVSQDTIRMAMDQLLNIRLYSPTDAVYDDLVSSGNLRLMTCDSLRHEILQYRRKLSRTPVTEQSDIDVVEQKLQPYLIQKQVLSLLELHRDIEAIDISEAQKDRIIRVLLNDRTFIDLVYVRLHSVSQVLWFETPMQWHLSRMEELIKQQLEDFEE